MKLCGTIAVDIKGLGNTTVPKPHGLGGHRLQNAIGLKPEGVEETIPVVKQLPWQLRQAELPYAKNLGPGGTQ